MNVSALSFGVMQDHERRTTQKDHKYQFCGLRCELRSWQGTLLSNEIHCSGKEPKVLKLSHWFKVHSLARLKLGGERPP